MHFTQTKRQQAEQIQSQNLNFRGLTNRENSGTISTGEPLKISMQFFANKNIPKMSDRELRKSIETWKQRVNEHEEYIKNPLPHCPEWENFDPRRQQGLIKHWQKEIKNFNNDIQEASDELKKRGE